MSNKNLPINHTINSLFGMGMKVRNKREEQNISRGELARITGTDSATIQHLEENQDFISPGVQHRICTLLGIKED